MSDFGANIFDDRPARPATPREESRRPLPPGRPERREHHPQNDRHDRGDREPPRQRPDSQGPRDLRGPRLTTADRRSPTQTHPTAHQPFPRPSARRTPSVQHPPAAPSAAGTTCLLVDLEALMAEARERQGEVAMQRLRQGLAGERPVGCAVAFTSGRGPVPKGFEVLAGGDAFADGVSLAIRAFQLVGDGSRLVLAPATPAMRRLAAALRQAGHHAELAGFTGAADVRALGRDCLFVP